MSYTRHTNLEPLSYSFFLSLRYSTFKIDQDKPTVLMLSLRRAGRRWLEGDARTPVHSMGNTSRGACVLQLNAALWCYSRRMVLGFWGQTPCWPVVPLLMVALSWWEPKMMGSRIARDSNNKACVGSLASDADEVVQASPYHGSGHEEKRQSNIMCSSARLSWS